MTAKVEPAHVAWGVIIAGGLSTSAVLIRSGRPGLSEVAGASWPARILVVYFALHFLMRPTWLRRLPRWLRIVDPLHVPAEALRRHARPQLHMPQP